MIRICVWWGHFPVNRPIKMKPMKVCMSEVWRLMKGVVVKETFLDLLLFQYFHKLDLEEVCGEGHGITKIIFY
jgi:hypothetical protein